MNIIVSYFYALHNIDAYIQDCSNCIANALELQQSGTEPLTLKNIFLDKLHL